MDPDPSQIVLLIASFMVLAFASAADAAFTSVNWRRISSLLADRAEPFGPAWPSLTEDPYRFKATIILLNTGATIVAPPRCCISAARPRSGCRGCCCLRCCC
ncbi:MAG: hypothetical protein HC893_04990 [Chloroflexaceae bacterium]|nr:hypothetical protein [Chloroflexaceae bacterium]